MVLSRVIGTSIAPGAPGSTPGDRLLIVQPIDMHGHPVGRELIALDRARASAGSLVLVDIDESVIHQFPHRQSGGSVHAVAVATMIGLDESFNSD